METSFWMLSDRPSVKGKSQSWIQRSSGKSNSTLNLVIEANKDRESPLFDYIDFIGDLKKNVQHTFKIKGNRLTVTIEHELAGLYCFTEAF